MKKAQYRKYKEIYRVDLDILKEVIKNCDTQINELNKKIESKKQKGGGILNKIDNKEILYLLIPMQHIQCEKYFNKYKCIFPVDLHEEIIQSIKGMEEQLLKKYSTTKIPYCKIYEQLKSGYIKLMEDIGSQPLCDFILKISGIWETQHHYGLTYKFIKTTHVVPET